MQDLGQLQHGLFRIMYQWPIKGLEQKASLKKSCYLTLSGGGWSVKELWYLFSTFFNSKNSNKPVRKPPIFQPTPKAPQKLIGLINLSFTRQLTLWFNPYSLCVHSMNLKNLSLTSVGKQTFTFCTLSNCILSNNVCVKTARPIEKICCSWGQIKMASNIHTP